MRCITFKLKFFFLDRPFSKRIDFACRTEEKTLLISIKTDRSNRKRKKHLMKYKFLSDNWYFAHVNSIEVVKCLTQKQQQKHKTNVNATINVWKKNFHIVGKNVCDKILYYELVSDQCASVNACVCIGSMTEHNFQSQTKN